MKGRIFLAGLGAAAIFVLAGSLLVKISGPQGSRVWEDIDSSLFDLRQFVDQVIEEEGARPDGARVNRIIEELCDSDSENTPVYEEGDPDYHLYLLAERIAGDAGLCRWGAPPVYVEKNDLPYGFGFYLRGEDGVTNSEEPGEDEDDLNTWGYREESYYEDRDYRSTMLKLSGASLIPSLLGFAILFQMLKGDELRKRIFKVVKPLLLFVGVPLGGLMALGLLFGLMLSGWPWSNSGWFYPSWKSKLPETATEVYERGRGVVIPGDYGYTMRAKVTREEFLTFCEELEMTLHSEERTYEDEVFGVAWNGYHPGCGGWWVPTDSIEETYVWQKGHTWEYAKYEGGYLYFSSFKH